MDMNFNADISGTRHITLPICQRILNTDVSEDFTLPDYNPEMRRVLYVKESLLPPARFISSNKLDVNGVVDYTLVYISNEGKLCSAPLSAEYAFSMPLDNLSDFDMNEGVSVMVHSAAESSSVRVSSPRKLQIRSHLRSNVSVWGKKESMPDIQGIEDRSSLQMLRVECPCADIICESSDAVTLSDEYILPSEDCRVAVADSAVVVDNCRVDGDAVHISGEVLLRMLVMCDGESRCERVVRKLAFDAESELDGVDMGENSLCRADGSVTDISLNVEEGKVQIEASLTLEVCVAQNRNTEYTCDIYSTKQNDDIVMREERLPVILENRSFNLTQTERVSREDVNIPEDCQITDTWASAIVEEVTWEEGKYILRGNCKYNIVCLSEGEYSCCEVKVPFKYETEGQRELAGFDAMVEVASCRASAEPEWLNMNAELCIACTLTGSESVSMVESVSFTDERSAPQGEWTVYYKGDSETPWQIAKRYGVRPEDISFSPESRFVMIER